jgi:RNA polymerase sigma-70 factor (ECF subfamily)
MRTPPAPVSSRWLPRLNMQTSMSGSEANLLARCSAFDVDALGEVYDRFSPALYRYAWRLTGNDDLAEDCVAETFGRYLTALRTGAGPTKSLQAYLYRVAHNWVTDQWRKTREESGDEVLERTADPLETSQIAEGAIERKRVRRALRSLTPDQRQVVMLKFYEGLDNREVARSIGKPVGAVKSLQHRALQALGRVLSREGE